MESVELTAELPPPTSTWRLVDGTQLVAAGGENSTAPRTVGDLVEYLQRGPGHVPVLAVRMEPNQVAVEYAMGCIVQELTYLTS